MTSSRGFAAFARATCTVFLAGFVFVSSGCHELYCNFVEGLTGQPLDCSHDPFPDLGDIELPPLPPPPQLPKPATITWTGVVVAHQEEEFVATTASFTDAEKPLRYRWDLDGDAEFDDHVGVGDEGRIARATFDAFGQRTVSVQVFSNAKSNPAATDIANGLAIFTVQAGQAPVPPPTEPPPNPLEVAVELEQAAVPGQEQPAVEVTASVSQDAAPVSGADVVFDFESDGTVIAERTTGADGRASATHDYPDGQHKVTVTARLGASEGSAEQSFYYFDGTIYPTETGLAAATDGSAAARSRRFSARLWLGTLRPGKGVRRGKTVGRRGELGMGVALGKLRRRAPASLRGFLRSTWVTRSNITFNRKRRRLRVSGVAVATFAGEPGQACIRYSASTRLGRRFGKGRLRLVGGTDAAATTRAVARVRVTARRGLFVLRGRLRTRTVAARGLRPACESLLADVRALPG